MFDGFFFMSFILVPKEGEDLQVNGWNWHPTLQLLLAAGVITEEDYEMLGVRDVALKPKWIRKKLAKSRMFLQANSVA
jgi:hypothetical protein